MARRKARSSLPDIGFVALPALCCLLAALAYTAVTSEEQANAAPPEAPPLVEGLKAVEKRLAEAEAEREALLRQIAELQRLARKDRAVEQQLKALAEAADALETEIAHLKEALARLNEEVGAKRARQAKIGRLQEELDRFRKQIRELKARLSKFKEQARGLPDRSPWLGNGNGNRPYILIECVKGGVNAYPGQTRIPLDGPKKRIDALLDRVERTGFVVLLVRPGGFEQSYPKFRGIVLGYRKRVGAAGKKIDVGFWPMTDDEPIVDYMPKGKPE